MLVRKVILIFWSMALVGCFIIERQSTPEDDSLKDRIVQWEKNQYSMSVKNYDQDYFSAVGIGVDANEELAGIKAELNADENLANFINQYVQVMRKTVLEGKKNNETSEVFEDLSVFISTFSQIRVTKIHYKKLGELLCDSTYHISVIAKTSKDDYYRSVISYMPSFDPEQVKAMMSTADSVFYNRIQETK